MTQTALAAGSAQPSPLQLDIASKSDGITFLNNARISMNELIDILSRETTLLRAGESFKAAELSREKSRISESYFGFIRAIQHNADRLNSIVPDELRNIRDSHQSLITQLSENLRVIATARTLSQDIINSVARQVGENQSAQTYGATGRMADGAGTNGGGLAVNRAF